MKKPLGLTFAIHATDRGFGFVAFEGPFTPYDWGIVFARGDKNAVCLQKIEIMLERFEPETLLLEAFGNGRGREGHWTALKHICAGHVMMVPALLHPV